MQNKLLISLLAAFALTTTGVVVAQDDSQGAQTERAHKGGHKGGHKGKMHEYMLKRVDTNEDGKVDLTEYLANAEQRFADMDLNDDGYVTPEEHREAGKIMREKHREMRNKMREERKAKSN